MLLLFMAAQLIHPALLTLLERDAARIRQGEWWRLATALLVQDGGLAGGISNIAALLLIGSQAEQLLRRRVWLTVFLLGAFTAEIVALTWQPVGAGNSVAVCALAGALAVLPSTSKPLTFLLRAIVLAATLFLLWRHDIHGVAILAGSVFAVSASIFRTAAGNAPSRSAQR